MRESILHVIENYGYWAVFIGAVLEGETLLLAGGFAASLGLLKFPWVVAAAFIGAIIGDNLTYAIGHHGGRPLLDRYGRYILLTPKRRRDIEKHFHQHGSKTLFITRFLWGTRLPTTLLAGASGMHYRRFMTANFISAIIWAIVVGALGFIFGHSWTLLKAYMKGTAVSLLIFFALALAVKWALRKFFHKELDA